MLLGLRLFFWIGFAPLATRFGEWEFDQFARDYQKLFGEFPLESLRRMD
jgi:hypothetical protein